MMFLKAADDQVCGSPLVLPRRLQHLAHGDAKNESEYLCI